VSKSKADGKKFSFAFAQFENAECAAAAMASLHGYVFDPENAELCVMQLRYAHQERSGRAPQKAGPPELAAPPPYPTRQGVARVPAEPPAGSMRHAGNQPNFRLGPGPNRPPQGNLRGGPSREKGPGPRQGAPSGFPNGRHPANAHHGPAPNARNVLPQPKGGRHPRQR
jgi:hypothetical protein